MKNINILVILALLLVTSLQQRIYAQKAEEIGKEKLEELMGDKSSEILMINFWASWCKPCIKEMPWMDVFKYQDKKIKVIFVSLDEGRFVKKSLPKVLKKLQLKSPVYRLLFKDYKELESVLKAVDEKWNGVLPATLVINTKKNKNIFLEGKLEKEDLIKEIASI